MTLQELFRTVRGAAFFGDRGIRISGLQYHSARVQPGNVFFAIRGYRQDGHRFLEEARRRGAAAVASELPSSDRLAAGTACWVQVPDARNALALTAAEFYRHPSRDLQLVGVTGTNGKTTVSFLIASILNAAARQPALLGTIEYRLAFGDPAASAPAPQTTPESLDLQRLLREVVDRGGGAAVMEVSSHSLVLERVTACSFHTAVFTNFARDHLDFHASAEEYFQAKSRLFLPSEEGPAPRFAILNADEERVSQLGDRTPSRVMRFGIDRSSDVGAGRWKSGRGGIEVTAQTPAGPIEISSALVGRHNVYNLLAGVAAGLALEVSPDAIQNGIRDLRVPGRMEAIEEGQPFAVFVDYAHTDEALKTLVASARELAGAGELILVFGCGGDRDRGKRPLMGLAAAGCDRVILTSDNPRTEDPLQILNDVMVGLQKGNANYAVEPDRALAIERALREARAGDTVLLAGKGHETYQMVGQERLPFDDRAVARAALRELGFEGASSGREP
jgi:UDP-N-acetylmuramoyl-L-alanyl-D-glutamate--2,6-diaminopimelate ligase